MEMSPSWSKVWNGLKKVSLALLSVRAIYGPMAWCVFAWVRRLLQRVSSCTKWIVVVFSVETDAAHGTLQKSHLEEMRRE